MRRSLLSPWSPSLVLAMALTALGLAGAVAQPPPPLDAKQIMLRVNAAYAKSFNVPRAIELVQTATTSQAGQPSTSSAATSLTYQKGDKARMNIAVSATHGGQLGSAGMIQSDQVAPASMRVDWIATGEELMITEECPGCPPPGTRQNPIKRLSTAALEGENPIVDRQELPDVVLNAPFRASTVVRDGKELYLLESIGPVQLSLDTKMSLKLWIEPSTLLIVGMEGQGQQTAGTATIDLHITQQVTTRFDVQIHDSVFAVKLAPDAVVTDLSREAIAKYKAFHKL